MGASFSAGCQENDEKVTVEQIVGFKSCPSDSVVFLKNLWLTAACLRLPMSFSRF
jgi:hypothetical protein